MTQPHKPIAQVESFFCNILLTIGSFYRNIKYHQTGLEGKNKQVNGILRGTAYNFTSFFNDKNLIHFILMILFVLRQIITRAKTFIN